MVLEYLWTLGARLRNALRDATPSFPGDDEKDLIAEKTGVLSSREKQKQRDQRNAIDQREIQERERKKEYKNDDETFLLLLVAEAYRRQIADVLTDIEDARFVARLAYTQAIHDEESAEAALEVAQRQAIILPDGRRVYFTRDNSYLYAEDHQRITDLLVIAEARSGQIPGSTSYEDYQVRERKRQEASESVEKIRNALDTLDDIQSRVESGKLSAEELRQARADTDTIIKTLPSEFRDEYGRIQAARSAGQEPSYRAADFSFSTLPPVRAEFFQAVHSQQVPSQSKEPEPDKSTVRIPAYRSTPDF